MTPSPHTIKRACTRVACALAFAALGAGCSSTPAHAPFASQWQQTSADTYTNPATGQELSRDQYSALVADQLYDRLSARGATGNPFCR